MLAYFPRGMTYWSPDRLSGAPPWAGNDLYDIDAKVSQADLADWQKQGAKKEMLRAMLQAMLTERCRLAIHSTTVEKPIYVLLLGKHGPKLAESKPDESPPSGAIRLPEGGFLIPGRQELKFFQTPMMSLAANLSFGSFRPVEDKTQLTGIYDFVLATKDHDNASAANSDPLIQYDLETLGLMLKPASGPMETLVVDHIERPSAN